MSDALRTRTGGVTLATIVLAGATVYASHNDRHATNNAGLAMSFEARASDWSDDQIQGRAS